MENNIKYDINIYGDLMIIDNEKQNIKIVEVPNIKKLFNEKQQLIKFLKDKIKEYEVVPSDINELDYNCLVGKYIALQEILDFVNKGGKDE